jgi:hypothetical protein
MYGGRPPLLTPYRCSQKINVWATGGVEQAMGGRHFVSHPLCPAHQDVRDGFPGPIPHTVTEGPPVLRIRRLLAAKPLRAH